MSILAFDVKVQGNKRIFFQIMQPSLDDIQQALNKATTFVLEVSRGIARWGQERFYQPSSTDVANQHGRQKIEHNGITLFIYL